MINKYFAKNNFSLFYSFLTKIITYLSKYPTDLPFRAFSNSLYHRKWDIMTNFILL